MNAKYDIRILVATPNTFDAQKISSILEAQNFQTILCKEGSDVCGLIDSQYFDMLLLDTAIDGVGAIEITKRVRLAQEHFPIILLSNRCGSDTKIECLRAGADDYVFKPLNEELLMLKTKVFLKYYLKAHHKDQALHRFSFGEYTIDFENFLAVGPKGEIKLTPKELNLLKLLIQHKNKPVSREQILHHVWGYDVYPSTRTIDNFVMALRKTFEPDPSCPLFIKSVRGVGYKFELAA